MDSAQKYAEKRWEQLTADGPLLTSLKTELEVAFRAGQAVGYAEATKKVEELKEEMINGRSN